MQVPPPPQAALKAATGILVGPLKVEFAGVAKSTWNFQRSREVELLSKARKKLGDPAGGAVDPSRSEGSRPPKELLSWKQTCVAGIPARIAALSKAHARPPTKVLPLNMLKEM